MVVSIYPSYDAVNNNLHIELTVNKNRTKQVVPKIIFAKKLQTGNLCSKNVNVYVNQKGGGALHFSRSKTVKVT